ncbi:T9SS type A sorting domain-containing protein [uncultured Lacinutrix sp.]|uniref:T9SS type A sorting domain-containing protein n=1 Tax=uncultured Lacinutrix sp. TaxID=574032 RepID=UPI002633367D|nr:T9SS type A sorting domain-containing protein [uncultured Lacinutrix sp.]
MKTLKTLLFFLLVSTLTYGQIKIDGGIGGSNSCGSCNDSNNDITVVDNDTFRSRYAQAYWWEICAGNATIVGSNTSRNVNISCVSGQTSTIKLTRFYNGNCIESCETFTCAGGGGGECQASIKDIWCNVNNGPNSSLYPTLIDSEVYLSNPFPNSASGYARWNPNYLNGQQAAGGVFGNLAANANNVVFPSQFYVNISAQTTTNPSGFYVPMVVHYVDNVTGAECTVTLNPLIDEPCGSIGPARTSLVKEEIKLYPNPIKKGSQVSFEGLNINDIELIEVVDFKANILQSLKPKSNSFNVAKLETGLYFVRFKTKNGIIQKRLVIE